MAKVEQRHREAAARAMFPHITPEAPLWRYVETGETDSDSPTARVAQALADAEARGCQSGPATPSTEEPKND